MGEAGCFFSSMAGQDFDGRHSRKSMIRRYNSYYAPSYVGWRRPADVPPQACRCRLRKVVNLCRAGWPVAQMGIHTCGPPLSSKAKSAPRSRFFRHAACFGFEWSGPRIIASLPMVRGRCKHWQKIKTPSIPSGLSAPCPGSASNIAWMQTHDGSCPLGLCLTRRATFVDAEHLQGVCFL